MIPDDRTLTEQGTRVGTQGRILLLACGALAREILDLRRANGWTHMDLHCLPANLHLWPDRIPDAVEAVVTRERAHYDTIFVVYADCGTGGLLQARCKALGVEMVEGPHCYAFFEGVGVDDTAGVWEDTPVVKPRVDLKSFRKPASRAKGKATEETG